ncbi:MAG: peptide-methionine (S)-S-oxide reductase MsrA [Candidatus Binatia bacterium]
MASRLSLVAFAVVAASVSLWQSSARSGDVVTKVPAPTVDEAVDKAAGTETAVFAGGCFWGVQGVYQRVQGVKRAVSGYAGGEAATAHYETVGSGRTGHAESVEITYDPKLVSYGELLRIYFSVVADPTQKDRQGPDRGTQYRSAIFTKDARQRKIVEAYIEQLTKAGVFSAPIVTTTETLQTFYPAEAYHQDFLVQNPRHPYIAMNDIPKVEALQRLFPDRYREQPVLVSASTAVAPRH